MPDLTVVAANLHNEREAVDTLARLRFDAALVAEAHHRARRLRAFGGRRYLTGPLPGPSREVGILLDSGLTVRAFAAEFLSPATRRRFRRVGKERWGHDAVIDLGPVDVALVVAHPVAGPAALNGTDAGHRLVRLYARASAWVEETIAHHKAAGREVVFGGDVQVRPSNTRPWSFYRAFERHDMDWFNDGIDVIAWTDGLVPVRRSSHDIGSDHPAIRVGLDINRTKRRNR